MKPNADVKEVPWKKIALIGAIVIVLVAGAFAGWQKFGSVTQRVQPPEESRASIAKYLKEKTGKSDFPSSVDVSKEKNPWDILKTAYDTPPDYKSVYISIGEHLKIADALLNSADEKERSRGLKVAVELCEVAEEVAYDDWLSARICDTYLFLNIDKVEEKPKNGYSREQLVQLIAKIYRDANEPDRLIQLGKTLLKEAGTGRRADGIRWRLARELEQRGEYKEAAKYLREITDPGLTNEVSKRLVIVERNLKQARN